MLTHKDWRSLRFSQSITARVVEVMMAVSTVAFLAIAASFFQVAGEIVAVRKMSLGQMIHQGWTGINPELSYPGTFVIAFEPFTFGIISAAFAVIVGIVLMFLISVRRRNQRFLTFLDRYQSSFSGTLPEDEDFESLIETVQHE